MISRIKFSHILGIGVSISMLVWIGYTYDWEELAEPLANANYEYLLFIPLIVIPNYIVRAVRWRLLMDKTQHIGLASVFRALMTGYLFNNIMPARAGDIIRVYHLNKNKGKSKSHLFASLLTERLGDMLFLLCLLSLVLVAYPDLPGWLKKSGIIASALTFTGLVILWFIYLNKGKVIRAIFSRMKFLSGKVISRLNEMTESTLSGLDGLFHIKGLMIFSVLTLLLWMLELLTAFTIAEAFGLDIALGNILFIIIVITIGTLVPSSPGFIGTYEFFGVQALTILGISGGEGLSFIIVLHAVNWLSASIIGSLCMFSWKGGKYAEVVSEGVRK